MSKYMMLLAAITMATVPTLGHEEEVSHFPSDFAVAAEVDEGRVTARTAHSRSPQGVISSVSRGAILVLLSYWTVLMSATIEVMADRADSRLQT